MKEFFNLPFDIEENRLIERIGGTCSGKPSPRTMGEMIRAIETIHEFAEPKAAFKILNVWTDDRFIHLNTEIMLKSKKLARVLSNCEKAAIFVSTLGLEIDQIIEENLEQCLHYSTILDAAASVAAESTVQSLQNSIEDLLSQDESATMRYSPGYCDWPLDEQEKLFQIFPKDPAGVSLSEDFLMSPKKSVSGIMGIGPSEIVEKCGNLCLGCMKAECPHRRQ
ncbi:MAG: vitamin B12 dependent-methionine synthase activation domain-containing protein [Thermodesulfobacteriota bacterium]|nr:vitamin B12 dependent-methionine synthase activation domain-containing protein [Thermodesulfobacteriota bacterium]